MKKNIFALIALVCAIFISSCGNKQEITIDHYLAPTYGDTVKLDTISYINGLQLGMEVNMMVQQFEFDYVTFFTALQQIITTDTPLASGATTLEKDSLQSLGEKIFTQDFYTRMNNAMTDTTGTAQIYANPEEKDLITKFMVANLGYSIKSAPAALQLHWILEGIKDEHNGTIRITDEQIEAFAERYMAAFPAENKKLSEQWLADIATVSDVKKTESGILYIIHEAGDANIKATADTDTIEVLYTGRTKFGQIFDSNRWEDMSQDRKMMVHYTAPDQIGKDAPTQFALNQVIKGWTEGMKLVGKGGKITLWIPSELAYGENGSRNAIGPNEALRFDVEVLSVNGK